MRGLGRLAATGLVCAAVGLGAAPASSQATVSTASAAPIFLATGAPRATFGTAYIPDGGRDADVFRRDLGYLGVGFRRYASLGDATLIEMLRDPDMVAVVPATLLGNPAVSFLFEGGHFAFRPTPQGLEPLTVEGPEGRRMAAVDLGPMTAGPPPSIGPEARRTTMVASRGLPQGGGVRFGLLGMRADEALLRRVLERSGLTLAGSALIGADAVAETVAADGAALMFMAQSQSDPALAGLMAAPGATRFHAVTNFGLVPAWPALAGPPPDGRGASPADASAEVAAAAARPVDAAPEGAAGPPAGGGASAEVGGEAASAPAAALPPAQALPFDIAATEALAVVMPAEMRPEDIRKTALVWRVVTRGDGPTRDLPFFDLSENARIRAMAERLKAATVGRVETHDIFGEVLIEDGAVPGTVIRNMLRGGIAQAVRLQDLGDPALRPLVEDPRLAIWQVGPGGLARIDRVRPVTWPESARFEDLPDPAIVAVLPAGVAPGEAAIRQTALAQSSQGAAQGEAVNLSSERMRAGFRAGIARHLGVPESAVGETGSLRFSSETGAIAPAEDGPALYALRAGDLRRPELTALRRSAAVDVWLLAWNRATPVSMPAPPPEGALTPETLAINRQERRSLKDAAGGVLALPRNGGEIALVVAVEGKMGLSRIAPTALGGWGFVDRPTPDAMQLVRPGPTTAEALATIFAQPGVAAFLPRSDLLQWANDLRDPRYDPLFDGSRRFVALRDGREVALPTLAGLAPDPPAPPPAGAFCGRAGGPLLIRGAETDGSVTVFHDDLGAVPLARAALGDEPIWRIAPAGSPYPLAFHRGGPTVAVTAPGVAAEAMGPEACETATVSPM